jgi:YD repeat-containing protein
MTLRFLLVCLLFCTAARAQENHIADQNFRGVKTMTLYYSEKDSSGNIVKPRSKILTDEFDTVGSIIVSTAFSKGLKTRKTTYTYDSLNRITGYKSWTPMEEKEIKYRYEIKAGSGALMRYTLKEKETIEVMASWRDSLNKTDCESVWEGAYTFGSPKSRECYNESGKLVQETSFEGFTDYRYDSLGNLTTIVVRQFLEGHCILNISSDYQNTYSNGQLTQIASDLSKITFSYNDRGFIQSQVIADLKLKSTVRYDAEYIYY